MGTFTGHALPGLFFLVVSLWWSTAIWIRFFSVSRQRTPQSTNGRRKNSNVFCSHSTFSFGCCPRFPVEGVFKVTAALVGITGEAVTAFRDGRFVNLMNLQHMCMFYFYGVNGAVDIMIAAGLPLPPGTDYVTMIMALLVEWLLFYFHLHGRSAMDVHVHTLLTLVIAASVVVVLFEIKYRHHVLCPLLRAVVTMLQGSWFLQIGFILYNPVPGARRWNEDSHDQIMIVTALFTGHLAAVVIAISVIGVLVYCLVRHKPKRTCANDSSLFQSLVNNNNSGKTINASIAVSSEESDF